ncbi:MAG: hypothetical protein KatS3mg105_4883 [Gemmatales bacterium]|nr:MAG: hypothetical protein KatS3mg105_4883 [Gemmatales bacterium]
MTHAPSLAEILADEHAALEHHMTAVLACLASRCLRTMIEQLQKTRAHLLQHFQLEERDGYMEPVLRRRPEFHRTASNLLQEHADLAARLDKLLADLSSASHWNEPLAQNVRDWLDQLRSHEIRENKLVHEAFNVEIGAED